MPHRSALRSVMLICALWAWASGQVSAPPPMNYLTGQEELDLLHHPKALPERAPLTPAQLRSGFNNPPAENRSMPLWVWNDEMEWPRLAEQLAQFKAQGMGGVFIHPRPGLMTEYLGSDWFRLWKQSVEEGKRLGIEVNIYDENSYPSGFSGGHVPSIAPDTAAQYVTPEFVSGPRAYGTPGSNVAVFAVERGGDGRVTAARRPCSGCGGPAAIPGPASSPMST